MRSHDGRDALSHQRCHHHCTPQCRHSYATSTIRSGFVTMIVLRARLIIERMRTFSVRLDKVRRKCVRMLDPSSSHCVVFALRGGRSAKGVSGNERQKEDTWLGWS